MSDLTLIFSLISLGFFGGFSHCIGMCSPFVITQISYNLQKMPVEKFSTFQKLKSFAVIPYHLGRITTYSFIGFLSAFITETINDFSEFKILSVILLILAALFFLTLLFERKLLPFKLPFLESLALFFGKKFQRFFTNPKGINGYILGLILGFIPCGLLYGAFLIAANISNPFLAAFAMFCFGVSTFPALFIGGFGGNALVKFAGFKILSKIIIALNAVALLLMAIKIMTVS